MVVEQRGVLGRGLWPERDAGVHRDVHVAVDEPGEEGGACDVDHARAVWHVEVLAYRHDPPLVDEHIRGVHRCARAVPEQSAAEQEIERVGDHAST